MTPIEVPVSVSLGVVPAELTGANADGVSYCYQAILNAIALAGSEGIVRFKEGIYYVENAAQGGVDSPDFTGAYLEFEPGAVLSIENVTSNNFRDWKFITPANVYVRNRSGSTIVQPNFGVNHPAGGVSNGSLTFKPIPVDFTTWTSALWTQPSVDQTTGTDTTTKSATQVTWAANSITSGQTQVAYDAITGAGDEFQVALNAKASLSSARAGLLVRCGTGEHWFFSLPDWRTLASVPTYHLNRFSNSVWTVESKVFAWGNEAYFYDNAAIPMLSVRIRSAKKADFFINGVFVRSITTINDITDIGVAANGDVDLNEVSFRYGTRMTRPSAPRGRTIKLGVVGDSVMNGIAASKSVAEVVCDILTSRHGIPFASVEVDVSVPGHKADQQEVAAEEADWSGCDFVLVSVGANDAGQATAIATYISNLEGIVDTIIADGSIPIFATFHNFISRAISDHTYDNSIANVWYRHGNYRAAALHVAASKGVRVADVVGAVGHVGPQHEQTLDGIHLSHIGTACYAHAFADAIIAELQE